MIISFSPIPKYIKHCQFLHSFADLGSGVVVVWQRRMSVCTKPFNPVLILSFRVTLNPDAEIQLTVSVFIVTRVKF